MSAFHTGTEARLCCLDPTGGAYAVVLAKPPLEPTLSTALQLGRVSAAVQHGRGVIWPDHVGQQLAQAALEHGGVALLAFCCLADAMACKLRLRREMGA